MWTLCFVSKFLDKIWIQTRWLRSTIFIGNVFELINDLEIVVDSEILDPSNNMGLAETIVAYSRYFVVNPTNCRKSHYFLINIYLYSRNISFRNKMDRINYSSLQVRYSLENYFWNISKTFNELRPQVLQFSYINNLSSKVM